MNTLVDFILASSSPRRIELLKNLDLKFKVIPAKVEENLNLNMEPEDISLFNANRKANSVALKSKDKYIAGFDTIVVFENKILGKPENEKHAFEMLKMLSNNNHTVITGFSIINIAKNIEIKKAVTTEVWFKKLENIEIKWYISTGEPFDKAGAYAIQGKGAFMIKKINGSYTNVVGLPLTEFYECLKGLK